MTTPSEIRAEAIRILRKATLPALADSPGEGGWTATQCTNGPATSQVGGGPNPGSWKDVTWTPFSNTGVGLAFDPDLELIPLAGRSGRLQVQVLVWIERSYACGSRRGHGGMMTLIALSAP